jgi:hypothetical protein
LTSAKGYVKGDRGVVVVIVVPVLPVPILSLLLLLVLMNRQREVAVVVVTNDVLVVLGTKAVAMRSVNMGKRAVTIEIDYMI